MAGVDWIDSFWAIRDREQDYGRQSALHFASILRLLPEVKSILASGVHVDARDQYGSTALDVATSTGDVDNIRVIYEDGKADLHARQMTSLTPDDAVLIQQNHVLHTAASYGHKEAIVYLLSAGAETLVPDSSGMMALDIVVDAKNRSLIKILMNKQSIGEVIYSTTERGRLQTLKWLVEVEGLDVSQCHEHHEGVIYRGARRGEFVNTLEVAIINNQVSCAQYLSTVIKVNPEYRRSAYFTAAVNGSVGLVDDLIARRLVDINAVDADGRTALHHAFLAGRVAVVSFLVQTGIDTAIAKKFSCTALELLLSGEDMKCSYDDQREILANLKGPNDSDEGTSRRGESPPRGVEEWSAEPAATLEAGARQLRVDRDASRVGPRPARNRFFGADNPPSRCNAGQRHAHQDPGHL